MRLTDDPLYTITVEWKRYVGHILAEEAIAEPMRKAALAELNQWMRHEKYRNRANPTGMGIYAAFKAFDKFLNLAENRRRLERMGRKNPKGDERLSRARDWEMEYLDGTGEGGSQHGVGESGMQGTRISSPRSRHLADPVTIPHRRRGLVNAPASRRR